MGVYTILKPLPRQRPAVSAALYQQAVEQALQRTGDFLMKDFTATVASWTTKPKFYLTIDEGRVRVWTDSEIYSYVNFGTRAHIIVARRAPRLAFQRGYNAKTTPGVIGSKAGGKFGPMVYAKQVLHPGFPPRNFAYYIYQRRRRTLYTELRAAFKRIAGQSR